MHSLRRVCPTAANHLGPEHLDCPAAACVRVSPGLAPYRLGYTLIPISGSAKVLPEVVVDEAGSYVTALGFIDYDTISGVHDVVLVVTDSTNTALDPAASFRANITNGCTQSPARLPSPEIVNAPPDADPWANPAAVAADAAPAVAVPLPEAPALAFTGTSSRVAATLAFVLLGLGFFTVGEQRRRRNS